MALVSAVPAIPQQIDRVPFCDIRIPDIMASNGGIVEEPVTQVIEDKVYVAVGKELKDGRSILAWVLKHLGGKKKICIIHVHQPAQMIPLMGGKFAASKLKEQQVRAYHALEREDMHKILDDFLLTCKRAGARAEKLYIESDCIEKGIVELISQHGIRQLVIGAAAVKHYSRRMMEVKELKSKKAMYVCLQAPVFCHIMFVCKGNLIYTREGNFDGVNIDVMTPSLQASPNNETGQSNSLRSRSVTLGQNIPSNLTNPGLEVIRRVKSDNIDLRARGIMGSSSPDGTEGMLTPQSRLDTEGSYDEWDGTSRRTLSQGSGLSMRSSSDVIGEALVAFERPDGSEGGYARSQSKVNLEHSSPPSVLQEGSIDEELYDQLEQAIAEAENSRREAFEESVRRRKAEKDAIEAIRRAKAAESLYAEDLKQRKEIEEALVKERQEFEKMKRQQDEVMEELRMALDQKSLLESQIAASDRMVKELEEKILSAVELLQNYKSEQDELQIERDNALKVAEELRQQRAEASSSHTPQFFSEFSFSEIEEATRYFDPSLKIGEGGYGSIFKGILRHTEVAIKMLHSHSLQGPSEFQQEVDVLSKLRHPNLVTLIGACPEAWSLIYEYLPNGSLEDRLSCKDNTPPLSWQTRIRIATELCSVLIFLHSSDPHIVHSDLKPANILLDANLVSKLSDFGICRVLCQDENSSNNTTLCHRTGPKGTFVYMDPEFLQSGELTPKSDVYSFGIILLRLLTGRTPLGITKEVQYALDKGNLKDLLDYSAGDWPYVQAQQLAHLALRCSEMNRKNRPDLGSEVWRVLEAMRASCVPSSAFRLGSEEHFQAPPYFICPIFQEVMQDPHVAADGFTYEAEALRGWLDSGHDTSPMTNLKLSHRNLVPNLALRSAIQEWLQQH